jgi:hypothetical protein
VSIVFIACDLFAFPHSKFSCTILCSLNLVLLQVNRSFSKATLHKKELELFLFSSKAFLLYYHRLISCIDLLLPHYFKATLITSKNLVLILR